MRTNELDYELPSELIAQHPVENRSESRLLVLDRKHQQLTDTRFYRIGAFLRAGDCLILNKTKVLPARFYGQRKSGAKLEGLFVRLTAERVWDVMLKGAGRLKPGETFYLCPRDQSDNIEATLQQRFEEGRCIIQIHSSEPVEAVLEKIGFPPLPPYIKRDRQWDGVEDDRQRYQTVFAERPGAVAAPTAGLHFTESLLAELESQGISIARLTLHVGIGTFKPVAVEDLKDHTMHSEECEIDFSAVDRINRTREAGGRIIAIGTTTVRSLESAAQGDKLVPFRGSTDLFITPGYTFNIVDALVTNFHLPRSTLLAMVGAFSGMHSIIRAYNYAIKQKYRFYSYGDAMLIL